MRLEALRSLLAQGDIVVGGPAGWIRGFLVKVVRIGGWRFAPRVLGVVAGADVRQDENWSASSGVRGFGFG